MSRAGGTVWWNRCSAPASPVAQAAENPLVSAHVLNRSIPADEQVDAVRKAILEGSARAEP